ncbi:hypothetical protein [Paenarthrobacter ureafaciens]|uniref:hypothetical protein n=1 Tax=Paenarthrobacter ureafaciens TaxID=37931 RepID=UPI003D33043F
MRINNVVKFTGVALAGLLALTACGSNESTTAAGSESSPSSSASASSSASPSASASESGDAGTSSGAYKAASWALPITDAGQKLGSIKGESFNVDIFQVATDVAQQGQHVRGQGNQGEPAQEGRSRGVPELRGDQHFVR